MNCLRPQEIIDNRSYKGIHSAQLIAMLMHYGFVETNDKKHHKFKHRDYKNLYVVIPMGGVGEVDVAHVKNSVNACMEVKRRNAERKQPVFSEIPESLLKALPSGTRLVSADHRVEFEHGAILDLDAANMPPVRHYMLEMRGNALTIRSTDYPLEAFSAHLNFHKGSANEGALKTVFEGLDAQVLAHANEVHAKFDDDLLRLQANHGYASYIKEQPFEPNRLIFTHPIYPADFSVPAPRAGQAIADETLETLDALLESSREACMGQMEMIEELRAKGWIIEDHPANGTKPHLSFSHISGQSFDVPVYGGNKIFDEAQVRAKVEEIENPLVVEPITILPESPMTQVAQGERPVKDGRVVEQPILSVPPLPRN